MQCLKHMSLMTMLWQDLHQHKFKLCEDYRYEKDSENFSDDGGIGLKHEQCLMGVCD